MAFAQKLSPDALAYFNEVAKKKFSEQACAFLNAYWPEVGAQAEFVFSFAYETMKYADMHAKGCSYIHLYDEGDDVDFNIGLYFYEKLCKRLETGGEKGEFKEFRDPQYKISQPQMLTAIVRKKDIKENVDVNFDGRVSFLEYLLDQYKDFANPADFVSRSKRAPPPPDPEKIAAAQRALEDVTKRIRAYEAERHRLVEECKLPGVKGLRSKNLLAQLDCGVLREELDTALIKAEAAVRIATKGPRLVGAADGPAPVQGTLWWMDRDLAEKKKRYGRK